MTWNVLKWVAIAAMLIDHTAAVMGGLFPFSWYDPMRDVGRIAFPIFAYGIAQGCVYTHSARRYLGRLLLFAVLSELPYRLALRAGSLAFGLFNVFFTLLAGAACCQIVKFCRSKGRRWAWAAVAPVAAIVLLCEILGTDYGGFGVLCILLPYLFWESKPARIIALGSVVAFLYIVVNNFSGFSSPRGGWATRPSFGTWPGRRCSPWPAWGWWPCTTASPAPSGASGCSMSFTPPTCWRCGCSAPPPI